ncbi:Hypothetical protein R9X50_00229000 [Acrodontium crateriforme]|uniref:Zn(2)-C6 fungal-type domain-containing protein n=1 Tax=Acrodontium crateriforme TaxID=150365 RepID=A0AAQ3R8F9_9PEZI|nr:Hypothetical protein R9X50_00229000 [Acrodontium crateriforme]
MAHVDGEADCSPANLSNIDEYAANPRFLELQEELRSVLFTGAASLAPSRNVSPAPSDEDLAANNAQSGSTSLDLTKVTIIPQSRLVRYLKNWITECAPYLDKFDEARHFGIRAPILAQNSPSLLYAILAFSARQTERKLNMQGSHDSLELYQESIGLLAPSIHAKDPNVLVTVCILACLELMSVSPRNWRRHVEGCAALFDSFSVNGFSGGILQAVFWCYARMELCGAIIANGAERTVLPLEKWVPELPEPETRETDSREARDEWIKSLFSHSSRSSPDMHANWAVYLCAKTCDLTCRWTRQMELGELDEYDTRPFPEQWHQLWDELQYWIETRPAAMLPIKTTPAGGDQIFPEILFSHWAAISGNQMYHAACIMMLETRPINSQPIASSPRFSPIWHARRVVGISLTNPHSGNLINAIQPLFIAGKLLSHRSEHIIVARLFKIIDKTTGWGALWRLRDLERAWGYEPGEPSSAETLVEEISRAGPRFPSVSYCTTRTMPVVRNTPGGKQRVRTGCLTCRKRRRKCDEQKPRCENCRSKNFECNYPSAFVFVRQQSSIGSPHPSETSIREPARVSNDATPSLGLDEPSLALDHVSLSYAGANQALLVEGNSQNEPVSRKIDETDLIRHFRYSLGMWLDIGDPQSSYSIRLLQLIKSNRILETAVLALAAYQRSLADDVKQDGDYEASIQLREQFESAFEQQDAFSRLTGNTLLMVGDIFSSSPLHWRTMLTHYNDVFGSQQSASEVDFGLGNALFWLHYRLDLAASIRLAQPPQVSLRSDSSPTPFQQVLSLAGIAMSNDSFEQWDPIFIAGLLLIAKDMTFEPQQMALAERLNHITLTTGISLGREIEDLKYGWNLSRYHDDAYD